MATTEKRFDCTLELFASAYTVPTWVSGQDAPIRIGSCVYGRYAGIYAYKVYGKINAIGLRRDGSWGKYGDSFPSHQAAYEALMATDKTYWGEGE